MSQSHIVYIVQCRDGSWYTGYTNNLEKRLAMHNEGKGAKYTRGRGPVHLIWKEIYESKTEALRQEYALKKLTRAQKENYVKKGGMALDEATEKLPD